ncbi:MAG: hypothetical protein FJ265_18290 [Planctomycetes bacterium]|nr:hypothetical protein [Planctomycetota bacterium]
MAKATAVYARNFVPFLLLGALVFAPVVWLDAVRQDRHPREQLPMTLLTMLLTMLLAQVLTGALTFGVVQQLRGTPAPIGAALLRGLQSLLRGLGTGLLVGLLVGLGFLLLIVPGVVLAIRFCVAVPASVIEGTVGPTALRRSAGLVRGNGVTIFWAMVVLGLLFVGVVFVASIAIGIWLASRAGELPQIEGWWWVNLLFQALINTFFSTLMATTYFLLRQGKEQVDAQQMAAVFD